MSEKFNPDYPLERFLYGSGEETAHAWEQFLDDPSLYRQTDSPELCDFPADKDECPEVGVWVSLVCDQLPSFEKKTLLAHAAACSSCAARLRHCSSIFSSASTAEEEAMLSDLNTLSDSGRHQLAVQLAYSQRSEKPLFLTRVFFRNSVIATALLTAIVSSGIWWHHRHTPERMLAEVYTHSRSYELRIPGAAWSATNPVLHLRGGSDSRDSAMLQDVRKRIESHLQRYPDNAYWLHMEARVDLLQERLDPAIAILDEQLRSSPAKTDLLVDDAFAHFQRGLIDGSDQDRSQALELLRHADELAPADPVILFNEAIVMEERGQSMNAIETWNRFLRFEHDPGWRGEGRLRLQNLEARLQNNSGK